jgi:hypothetical protein
MKKFSEVLDHYMAMKYQLAVWDEVMNFLGQFTVSADGTAPRKEIPTEVGEVPIDHIEEVKELVDQKTAELREKLDKLGDTEISNGKKAKKGAKVTHKAAGKKVAKGGPGGAAKRTAKPARLTLPKARGRGKGAG